MYIFMLAANIIFCGCFTQVHMFGHRAGHMLLATVRCYVATLGQQHNGSFSITTSVCKICLFNQVHGHRLLERLLSYQFRFHYAPPV